MIGRVLMSPRSQALKSIAANRYQGNVARSSTAPPMIDWSGYKGMKAADLSTTAGLVCTRWLV
jgi:hypothetical protein